MYGQQLERARHAVEQKTTVARGHSQPLRVTAGLSISSILAAGISRHERRAEDA
jgi:hypothetical protein